MISKYFLPFLFFIPLFANGQTLIDFDELVPPDQGNGDFFFDGYGESATTAGWLSRGAAFNTNLFGPGWSYSRVNDTTTMGFTNQWAAITGTDAGGAGNYALANSFEPNGAIVNLPEGQAPDWILVTNSTFAFLSMLNGDGFAKQFGGASGNDPDFFKVIFTGFDGLNASGQSVGSVDFYLADFRFADNSLDFIVDVWTLVDLSGLANAQSIGISFESSDVGDFGINTPTYVAVDELQLVQNVLLGDVNQDGAVDLLDVTPFVELLTSGQFLEQADINQDGEVDLLDVQPFVELLAS